MLGKVYVMGKKIYFTMEEGIAFSHKGISYPYGNFLTSFPSLPTAFFIRELKKTGEKLEDEFFMCQMDANEMSQLWEKDNVDLAFISPHFFLYSQLLLDFGLTYVVDKEKAYLKLNQFLGDSKEEVTAVWSKINEKPYFPENINFSNEPYCTLKEFHEVIEEVSCLLLTDITLKQKKLTEELEFLSRNLPNLGALQGIQKLFILDTLNQKVGKQAYYTNKKFEMVYSSTATQLSPNLDPFQLGSLLLEQEIEILEMCVIHNMDDLIRYELLHLVTNNFTFHKCQHCGCFFVPMGRVDSKYCDRIMWGETKPCNKIGASRKNQLKIEKDPLLLKSQRVYKKFHNRLDRNKHNLKMKEDFRKWKYELAEKRSAYLCGDLSAAEFEGFLEGGM